MKLFVGYATQEGQSRKIAQWIADHLFDAGHGVQVMALEHAGDLDLKRFERCILVGPVHAGRYPQPLATFAADHAEDLASLRTLFVSVSLAAAGHDAEEWRSLDRIVADLCEATEWTPSAVAQVAGAYKPSEYDLFTRFIMRRIIAEKDAEADLGADREYTDWAALGTAIDAWVAG